MNTLYRIILGTGLAVMVLTGCTDKKASATEETSAESSRAAEVGARHGKQAAEFPPYSYERDEALLDIKARESHLRAAGVNSAADAYINAAREAYESNLSGTEE